MNLFGNIILKNPLEDKIKKKNRIIDMSKGMTPCEKRYKYGNRIFAVERGISTNDLDIMNKNRNISIRSVSLGHSIENKECHNVKQPAHISFVYRGKNGQNVHKYIVDILKRVPLTLSGKDRVRAGKAFDEKYATYEMYGRVNDKVWFHNAALTISKIT